MNLAFTAIDNELKISEYNVIYYISLPDDVPVYDKVLETTKLDNIENYTIKRFSNFYFTNAKYSKEYQKMISADFFPTDSSIYLICLGDKQYRDYISLLGLKYDDIKDKGILCDYAPLGTYHEETDSYTYQYARIYDYSIGDTISGNLQGEKPFNIDVGYVTDIKPFGFQHENNAKLFISDSLFDKYATSNTIEVLYLSNKPDKLQDDIEALDVLKNINCEYSLSNINENVQMLRNLFTLLAIFLYGFITVITLIGLTNIFNTITINVELRKPEFAMLKSIGMTSREFNRMIYLESFFMGIRSLLFGIPLGIGFSYLIYLYFLENEGMIYEFPLVSIVLSILAVFLLIFLLMKYSINKIKKQNTIETIRNENI